MKVYFCNNINEALGLAEQLKADGRFSYFRGQSEIWPLTTTLQRKGLDDYQSRTIPFLNFLSAHPVTMSLTIDHQLSIAQHYGFPTPLLDVTTSPRVAAHFARPKDFLEIRHITNLTPELRQNCELQGDLTALKGWGCIYCLDPKLSLPGVFPKLFVPGNWRENVQESCFLVWKYMNEKIDDWLLSTKLCFPQREPLDSEFQMAVFPEASGKIEAVWKEFLHVEEREGRNVWAQLLSSTTNVRQIHFDPPQPEGDKIPFVVSPYRDLHFDSRLLPPLDEFKSWIDERLAAQQSEVSFPGVGASPDIAVSLPVGQIHCERFVPHLYQIYCTLHECFVPPEIASQTLARAFRIVQSLQDFPNTTLLTQLIFERVNAAAGETLHTFELVTKEPSALTRTLLSYAEFESCLNGAAKEILYSKFAGKVPDFIMSHRFSLSSLDPESFRRLFFVDMFPRSILIWRAGMPVQFDHQPDESRGPHYALLVPPFDLKRFGLA